MHRKRSFQALCFLLLCAAFLYGSSKSKEAAYNKDEDVENNNETSSWSLSRGLRSYFYPRTTHNAYYPYRGGRRRHYPLDIRFSKTPMFSERSRGVRTLKTSDYPIRGRLGRILKEETTCMSVVTADDYELHGKTAEEYIRYVGGPPSMPHSDPNNDFWHELRHVVDVQIARRRNVHPNQLTRWPDLWRDYDIHEVAEAVHDEYPGYNQQQVVMSIFGQGPELDYDIMPFRSHVDILGLQIRCSYVHSWAISLVGPTNFLLKWTTGRPRPEEMAWLIHTGELTTADGVPRDIVRKIRSMNLRHAHDFTAYPEGCPTHPAWPAMHSAASVLSVWLPVLMNLTPAQYCEVLLVDYATAYGRTVAGVHYQSDNIVGLNLGQKLVSEKLADHLCDEYDCDRRKLQRKIDHYRFDWADFNPRDCTIRGRPVGY